jgi:hypothetical protein
MKLYLLHCPRYNQRGFSGWTLGEFGGITPFYLPSLEIINAVFHENCPRTKLDIQIVTDSDALSARHIIRLPGQLRPNQRERFLQRFANEIAV